METLMLFCCKSCIRGDDNQEYYKVLGLDPNSRSVISTDEIKKSYKKISLNLHPDKLAQRGIEITSEHKQQFLKAKEAYNTLSDSKRKRLYDDIGESGLKFIENPGEVNPVNLIKNFQKNRYDRVSLGLFIALIFLFLFLLPVLFSLKCDGTLPHKFKWVEVWIPMWLVDLVLIFASILIFLQPSSSDDDVDADGNNIEEDNESKKSTSIPLIFKMFNFTVTTLYILIQIFIVLKLDNQIDWSWYLVFIPWYIHEIINVLSLFKLSLFTKVKLPDHATVQIPTVSDDTSDELIMEKIKLESEYFDKVNSQSKDIRKIISLLLRLWLSIFIALKLESILMWNWGLVLLPIWIYLLVQYLFIVYHNRWGKSLLKTVDEAAVLAGEDTNPMSAIHLNQGKELVGTATVDFIVLFIFVFMSILLVSNLQLKSISTFIIILPIFIILGCSCCVVYCGLFCFANVDLDSLNDAFEDSGDSVKKENNDSTDNIVIDISEDETNDKVTDSQAILTPLSPLQKDDRRTPEYGSFDSTQGTSTINLETSQIQNHSSDFVEID